MAMCVTVALLLVGCGPSAESLPADVKLVLSRDGTVVKTLSVAEMASLVPPANVDPNDPVYRKPKHYRGIPLGPVLKSAFGELAGLRDQQFVIRASDGYAVPVMGDILGTSGAYLAYRDREVAEWEPIGPKGVNPGPFYLVWGESGQRDTTTYPWPWSVTEIEAVSSIAVLYAKTAPPSPTDDVRRGHEIFLHACIKCHAVNRQGGHVGPELNVPKNITEYWPAEQIKAFVKNPSSFRYGSMPGNPHMSDDELSALVAYLSAMKAQKMDEK